MTDPKPENSDPALSTQDHGLSLAADETAEPIDPYVLRGAASTTVEKITLKHGDAFMLTDARGDMPTSEQETGLFWHGMRFLRACDLFVEGQPMVALSTRFQTKKAPADRLTNPFLRQPLEQGIFQGVIHLRRQIELRGHKLTQIFLLTSFEPSIVCARGTEKLGGFSDIVVRGMERAHRGEMLAPHVEPDEVVFCYRGLDAVERKTHIMLDPPADLVVNDSIFGSYSSNAARPSSFRWRSPSVSAP